MLLLVACNLPQVKECRAEKEGSLQAWLPHACICRVLFHKKAAIAADQSRAARGSGGLGFNVYNHLSACLRYSSYYSGWPDFFRRCMNHKLLLYNATMLHCGNLQL